MATIERHLLALAGNWLHWGCTGPALDALDALHPLSVSARSKHFRRNSQSKLLHLLLLQFSFLPLVVGFAARVSQPGPINCPRPAVPLPLPYRPSLSLSPSLSLANLLKCRRLALPFHTFHLHLHIPLASLSPSFSLCPPLCSFFVA